MDDTLRRIRAENGIIRIGKMGEIPPAIVEIPIGKIQWGAGRVEIKFHRAGDTGAYLAEHVEIDGSNALWYLSEADLCRKGAGEAQVVWYAEDGHRLKSDIYRVIVDRALEYDAGEPDVWTGVCDRVAGYAGQAERAAESADTSAKSAQAFAAAAAGSAGQASEECARAGQAAQEADQAAVAAAEKARLAEAAAEQAGQAAQAAEQSKAEAENAGTAAENAKTAAQTATEHAETAERSAAASLRRMEEQAGTAAEKLNEAAEAVRKNAEVAEKAAADAGKSAEKAIAAQLSAENAKTDAAESAKGAKDAMAGAEKAAAQANANAEAVAAGQAAQDQKIEALEKAGINDGCISAETPWSSKKIIDMLCPALEETGNPVTCYPVAGYPLGVVASWEPTQAGEGEPYPAGGGKNLIPYPSNIGYSFPITRNGLTITSNPDGSYTVNGTATANTYFAVCYLSDGEFDNIGTVTLSGCPKGGNTAATNGYYLALYTGAGGIWKSDVGSGGSIDFGVLGAGARIEITVTSGYTANNLKFWPQLEKGSTATAYAPYENIRPISGRDAVSVERCGVNLLQITPFAKNVNKGVTFEYVAPGGIKISGTAAGFSDSPVFAAPLLPPGKYYGTNQNNINASIVVTRDGERFWQNTKGIFDIKTGDILHYWYISINAGTTIDTIVYPYIVPGTTAPTTYAPYQGDTLDLQLPETVYGGSVDAVSGQGQNAWKLLTLDGDETWNTWGVNAYNPTVTGFYTYDISDYDVQSIAVVCSNLSLSPSAWGGRKVGVGFATDGNSRYFIYSVPSVILDDISDNAHAIASLKSYLASQAAAGSPVQIAYRLDEHVRFRATGNGPIMPLEGETNTIMTDSDSVTVTGRADPAHAIAALQAQLATATQQLVETQAAVVDYIYEQDLAEIGLEEVDDSDNQTDTGAADVPGV